MPAEQVLTREPQRRSRRPGRVVATITARAVEPRPARSLGRCSASASTATRRRIGRRSATCNADPLCAGDPVFNDYSVEVVQRIGYDSFTPDSGVLIAKNKDGQANSCGYGCSRWVIDAHPEDIKRLDFVEAGRRRA